MTPDAAGKAGVDMPVMDEFKEERDKVKAQPLKKRLEYFWDYYKWYVIGGILAVVLLCNFIHSIVSKKDYALFGIVVDGSVIGDEEALLEDFYEYAKIDTDKYEVLMNSDLSTSQSNNQGLETSQFILTHLTGRDLDFALMESESYQQYSGQGLFLDLRLVLDEELFAALEAEGRIFYADGNPIPVGIYVRGIKRLEDVYYFASGNACIGIISNSKKSETAAEFIEFLLTDAEREE